MRVLIAEDDATSRLILKASVERLGHEALTASDGLSAWNRFRESPCEVVISDRVMPEMDGMELCRRVRGSGAQYSYFIFLTALDDRKSFMEGMQNGADDYLVKPIEPGILEVRLVVAERIVKLHRELWEQKRDLERLNRDLFELSRRDPLTETGNRLRLREDLEQLCSRSERYGSHVAVGLCDIDFFKAYNDHYGHLAGDEVLQMVARTLRAQTRSGDGVYRYGGEEFLLVLPEQTVPAAQNALGRICAAIRTLSIPHELRPAPHTITISAGIASTSQLERRDMTSLLKAADRALYEAKSSGRNCVVASQPLPV